MRQRLPMQSAIDGRHKKSAAAWRLPRSHNYLCRSGREEIDRFGCCNRFDVARIKAEQQNSLHKLSLQVEVTQFTGNNFAGRNLSVRCNRKAQDQFAFELLIYSERTIIEREDCPLVLVEHEFDFFTTA